MMKRPAIEMTEYNIHELEKLADTATRTIRYYIQLGLVDRPIGAKKSASYSHKHIEQLLKIKQWKAAGLNLNRISHILDKTAPQIHQPIHTGDAHTICRIFLKEGLNLDVDRQTCQLTDGDLRKVCRACIDALNNL